MTDTVFDWHLDWIIGLLIALNVLSVVIAALLGSIYSQLKNWDRHRRYEYPTGPTHPL